ncbi:MAG: phosphate ABC transporter permease PstA [Alphaproteobacteria bacterium]|nr:phosphate ABC transporter permease PstA [Alphaproteobacteria bacterium]
MTASGATFELDEARLRRRRAAETRFRIYGLLGIALAVLALGVLLVTIVSKGHTAFFQSRVVVDVFFDPALIDPDGSGDIKILAKGNFTVVAKRSLQAVFPDVSGRRDKRALTRLLSDGASRELRDMVLDDPALIGTTQSLSLLASDDVDMLRKGHISRDILEAQRALSDQQLAWLDSLDDSGRLESGFAVNFFTSGDSREPELAGIGGAAMGSLWTVLTCLLLSVPLGVMTAVYLEEFATRNRWTDLIEVNINNLAAVPSIVFGLLGLAVFLNVFGMPRSAPLVGGMVLALMTLPTVIIAARAALMSVPPSIRDAALGVGASPMQVVLHHVLPLATPGIMTGTIIGMARALGETAPLLMIGMVAFIVDVPGGPLDPATALPVQIYIWADSPERGFVEKTSAAIMVLLAFLILMNTTAVLIRQKFEKRW